MYGPTVRCKGEFGDGQVVLRQCIRPRRGAMLLDCRLGHIDGTGWRTGEILFYFLIFPVPNGVAVAPRPRDCVIERGRRGHRFHARLKL